ncbi:MAG: HAMP domain-containing histidine kinase [Actinomycetota bacterium]|nr:HAMP domain-containing histidine kinase [Actinomycetota bacterium]
MSSDEIEIVAIALSWSVAVSLVGVLGVWLLRRRSVRWSVAAVGLVAVGAFVTGLVGTARAMFLSEHDFDVVLLVCMVAGAVSVVFALVMGESVVRWSRFLQTAARNFGERGAFAAPGRGPAEFEQLAAELSRTSEKLNEAQEHEQRLEVSRRELVAWVSHDLRTPLAGLRAMAEALEDGLAADPGRYHAQIRAEVDRMSAMVDDLFELSRIHAGALQLVMEEVSLDDLVSQTLAGADPVARAGGVRLGVRLDAWEGNGDGSARVRGDAGELSRVLTNLVMNAVRHTPADGTVEVQMRRVADWVELSVHDECGGISEEDLPRVFDVGWRGSNARTPSAYSGAGLGLAIVKGIVEGHQGTVTVASDRAGCRFSVRLPA